jgi:hypothetical protein
MAQGSTEGQMRLCDRARLQQLIDSGALLLEGKSGAPTHLDDFRIGLHLDDSVQMIIGECDLSLGCANNLEEVSLSTHGLKPGDWCLGRSVERLALSGALLGVINTRSRYARLGLEMVGSSWLVAPGFGISSPTSIVFEIRAHAHLKKFADNIPYAYIAIFELNAPLAVTEKNYPLRFPFLSST